MEWNVPHSVHWISILLICRYHGMWFGQKENGITGFFEHEKTIKTDDDDQGRCVFIYLFIYFNYLFIFCRICQLESRTLFVNLVV